LAAPRFTILRPLADDLAAPTDPLDREDHAGPRLLLPAQHEKGVRGEADVVRAEQAQRPAQLEAVDEADHDVRPRVEAARIGRAGGHERALGGPRPSDADARCRSGRNLTGAPTQIAAAPLRGHSGAAAGHPPAERGPAHSYRTPSATRARA
jgi:hypothetical protein